MALAARLRAVPPDDPIRDVRDDPRVKGAAGIAGRVRTRYDLLSRRRLALTYETLRRPPALRRFRPRQATPHEVCASCRATLPYSLPRHVRCLSRALPSSVASRFCRVRNSSRRRRSASRSGNLIACWPAGLGNLRATVDVNEKLAEAAAEYGRELLPVWNAAVLEMYRAAQELSRSTTRFRELRAKCIMSGIRTEILKSPNVSAPLVLGDETDQQSQISFWRRTLEAWKIL